MATNIKPGVVIFTGDHQRLAKFYEAMTGLAVSFTDDKHTVMGSDTFELVIHSLSGESAVSEPPIAREDTYIKPLLRPQNEEWSARRFRACEAIDPDGNVIQFRESLT